MELEQWSWSSEWNWSSEADSGTGAVSWSSSKLELTYSYVYCKQINFDLFPYFIFDRRSLSFAIIIFAQTPPSTTRGVTPKSATIISKSLELWTQALQETSDIHAVACIQSDNVGITVRHITLA